MNKVFENRRFTIDLSEIKAFRVGGGFQVLVGNAWLDLVDVETYTDLKTAWLHWLAKQEEGMIAISGEVKEFRLDPVNELAASIQDKNLYERYQAEIVEAFKKAYIDAPEYIVGGVSVMATKAAKTFLDNLKAEAPVAENPDPYQDLHTKLASVIYDQFEEISHASKNWLSHKAQGTAKLFLDDLVGIGKLHSLKDDVIEAYTEALAKRLQEDWLKKYDAEEIPEGNAMKAAKTLMNVILGK